MKSSVRILDTAFNLHGEIDDYESLQMIRRYYRPGEFEMHIAIGKQSVDQLQKERVIIVNNQPHKSGIIMHSEINQDDKGGEILTVRGPTLGGVFDRRITVTDNYDRIKGSAETVMKYYVNNHIVNGIYPERRIPFFAIAADQGRGKQTPWQTRFEPLNEVVQGIAEWCDIGWLVKCDINLKKWVFDVLIGRDLTVDQHILPPVIFSHEYDNIQSQQFVDSDLQFKNVGYAGGKGEDANRLIQVVGSGSGLNRREVFLDCSSAESVTELTDMGNQHLSGFKQIRTYDGKILSTGSFVYERDWDLGDVITQRNQKWGLTMNSRITEVKEIYEPASSLEISLGNEIPTITKFVKQLQSNVKRR
ncbi:siphovirus ReqiPepy6 Gp37-like family protein [Paenibacillus dokdonensis]|uniref:Siphovirus ReqiPepy6 Gp37-like family protein n=1 Tax=Paenibacillus dokdonensis TaxID=2567944 RepID=A0ABU6GSN3_9BACL|nr:siphovirus ReqiPepy6 Gp37-like family protein [Paenibacillus dokdonensis]MEC0242761.1 siphovirus ReqiPepy6 Gp37-like family protein [Paenibacillus dokdonensis]